MDTVAAVIIAVLALTVLLCLGAISPVLWTFASDTASHIRSELSQCLEMADTGKRLACYDEIARRPQPHPAKGANAPAAAFHPQVLRRDPNEQTIHVRRAVIREWMSLARDRRQSKEQAAVFVRETAQKRGMPRNRRDPIATMYRWLLPRTGRWWSSSARSDPLLPCSHPGPNGE